MKALISLLAAAVALMAAPVFAHTGVEPHGHGLVAGLSHPLGGVDHLLAMIAVGVLAAQQGGRALWRVPAAFVAMMLVGAAVGMTGFALPHVELGIVGSVILLGLVIAGGARMPWGAAALMVGVLALFHGFAHGAEAPAMAAFASYAAGFAIATAALHGFGIALTLAVMNWVRSMGPAVIRIGGGAVALSGLALLAG
ncbi:HupE/UreJ family protein [Magnetofaba australis]|uniref:Putative HupE/UreJ protein n=1 Tax=Magnetofaba australis IT-1 TaxID=1434232 RepID=A0A1Y2JZ82_9PROT|nr:HupE/UreJ family protein [Magnetofaba australis]OSM00179.1 putative HupE/UreJ protein [Magnetofaba australis IT-1]